MSFDLDREEFYQTFTELQNREGMARALEWAWTAIDWTQQELNKKIAREDVDGEIFNMGRSEGHADIASVLRNILDPEDKNHWNIVGVLKEVIRISGERAAVVAHLRAAAHAPHPIEADTPMLSPSGSGLLLLEAERIERGEHRREEE